MQLFVALVLLVSAVAAIPRPDKLEPVPILRSDSVHEGGKYSFDFETGDGVVRSEAGQPEGEAGAVVQAGQYS